MKKAFRLILKILFAPVFVAVIFIGLVFNYLEMFWSWLKYDNSNNYIKRENRREMIADLKHYFTTL